MCHIVLALPLLALPVFWLLPPAESVPVYAIIVLLSLAVYRLIMRVMSQPVMTGAAGLLQKIGEVVDADSGLTRVRVGGELWQAQPLAGLRRGDAVKIIGIDGLNLTIERAEPRWQGAKAPVPRQRH